MHRLGQIIFWARDAVESQQPSQSASELMVPDRYAWFRNLTGTVRIDHRVYRFQGFVFEILNEKTTVKLKCVNTFYN